ncbi:MAG: hypothetical protein V4671_18440 [Armatimonadota bacterium]
MPTMPTMPALSSYVRPTARFAVSLVILPTLVLGALSPAPAHAYRYAYQVASSDTEAIAAFKKAALVVEGSGDGPVTASGFYARVTIRAEGKGQKSVAAECQKYLTAAQKGVRESGISLPDSREPLYQVLRRTGPSSYQGVMGAIPFSVVAAAESTPSTSDDTFQVTTEFDFGAESPAKMRAAFAAMRLSGAQGLVTVGYSCDEKAGRNLALKAALTDAKQRLQIFSEAAKPKVFDLVYVKEGEYQLNGQTDRAELQGSSLLQIQDTINTHTSVTLFYGFKPQAAPAVSAAPKAPLKAVKAVKAVKAARVH